MDYVALKNEFVTDPRSYGYAPFWANGQDWKLAELINEIRAIPINRDIIPAHEIFEAIVPTEWVALSVQEKERIRLLLGMGDVNVRGANTRASFQAAFATGTQTRTNLTALLTRNGSRAEELFGVSISWDDIAKARRV
jgi:hypothetical protein